MDAAELMDARLAVREEKERSAVDCVKSAYGEKYDPMLMHDSKRDVANLLHEESDTRSVPGVHSPETATAVTAKAEQRRIETVGSDKISAGLHFERCTPDFSVLFVKPVEFFIFLCYNYYGFLYL